MSEDWQVQYKRLTNGQYDQCKVRAKSRIEKQAGTRPRRRDYQNEAAPVWHWVDLFALAIFLGALLVSSAHIIHLAGQQAAASFAEIGTAYAGTKWSSDSYGNAHQIGYLALAESSMILFTLLWAAKHEARKDNETMLSYIGRLVFSPLLLAVLSMVYVFYANATSGLGILESILPPTTTAGLGIYFEGKIAQSIQRQRETSERYSPAMESWRAAQGGNVERHRDFLPFLRQEVAASLRTKNKSVDIPPADLIGLVVLEMQRETMFYDDNLFEAEIAESFTHAASEAAHPARSMQLAPPTPQPAPAPTARKS